MSDLRGFLQTQVSNGTLPGAVALLARGDSVEFAAAGEASLGGAPMARDTIFRFASITKPITAAAVMLLVDDGTIRLDDPVDRWLPELAAPKVVRTPASDPDDVVPAVRQITVFDLLNGCAGYGFASDFGLPAVQRLAAVQKDGREVQSFPAPDVWMAELAQVPLLRQPGEAWLYDTCSTLQGVLVTRVTGQPLPDFMAERIFGPLGMKDTAFVVPAAKRDRFTSYYRNGEDGALELADPPDGQWSTPPAFPLGNGGLAGTADDWLAFARMMLADGAAADGHQLLSKEAVHRMTTDQTTPAQREMGQLFLDGQGWGFGGSVDIAAIDPWNVPGRYGWVGGTGTTAYIVPSQGTVSIMLTQVAAEGPAASQWLNGFWAYAASAG
ncbi:MAG TPA: serine hydrolase domain-containing protein [Streptosporangiaceae bacterium]|nr:serine hydrolase domain-containing protein [Streptosporangiaceae bacterium]